MSNKALDALALWILIPSIAVIIVIAVAGAWGTPKWLHRRRQQRQHAKLIAAVANISSGTPTFVVYWDQYRDMAKIEIVALLRANGWAYQEKDIISATGWALAFEYAPGQAANER